VQLHFKVKTLKQSVENFLTDYTHGRSAKHWILKLLCKFTAKTWGSSSAMSNLTVNLLPRSRPL